MLCFFSQGYCSLSGTNSTLPQIACTTAQSNVLTFSENDHTLCHTLHQEALFDSVKFKERAVDANPSSGRVMLIDGTSIIYRAYYKLLGMTW